MFKIGRLFLLLAIVLAPAVAAAQGFLLDTRPDHGFRLPHPHIWPHPHPPQPVPTPERTYTIKELSININLTDQIAKTQVSQTFVNTGSQAIEVAFVFPLPYDGAIDQMTFMVDGKEYPARLMDAKEARRIYQDHVRRLQDPALLEWIGNGMFQTSVFPVPPGAQRKVMLRFSQLCRKDQGLTELLFPLSTAKYTSHPVESVQLDVAIQSQVPIKNLYSPTHAVNISRPTERSARVTYASKNEVPTSDFRLLYDVSDAAVGASVISYRPQAAEEGYFMLLVSPEIKRMNQQPLKKTVIFVVDRSGSMSGQKIEQAKGALKFVLNNLNEGDLFNIVAYDTAVESFRPELQKFDPEIRTQALGFVEGLYAGGSTNIDGALKSALAQLQDNQRPNYVIFLTDGIPTAGETNEPRIVANAKDRNGIHARVFSLGVGYDVNSRLLDKLSRTCFGQSQYVRPNENLEEHVSRLYNRIGAPALTNLAIKIDMEGFPPDQGSVASRLYPRESHDLFAGEQLVVVGRYKKGGAAKIVISGQVDANPLSLDFPATFVEQSPDETHAFVEKLWALRRVGEIIDEIDLQGQNQELVNELVALATRHGIVTPYTAFLADETTNFRDLTSSRKRTGESLSALDQESGRAAFELRRAKGALQDSKQVEQFAFPAAGATRAVGGGGGGGGGLGAALAADGLAENAEDSGGVAPTVQTIGRKTFFKRENRWIDSTVTAEQERTSIKLTRFSDEFFDLISQYGRDVAKYLAIEGDVLIVLDGQAYSF